MKEADLKMSTRSQDQKAALQAENDLIRLVNQHVSEVDKQITNIKRQKKLNQRNSIIVNMAKIIRDNGASNLSIQKAFPGLKEFAPYAVKMLNNPTASEPMNSQAAPATEEETPGLFLSQVETREVDWL